MSGQGEIRTRGLYHAKVTIFQLIYLPSKSDNIVGIYNTFYFEKIIKKARRPAS